MQKSNSRKFQYTQYALTHKGSKQQYSSQSTSFSQQQSPRFVPKSPYLSNPQKIISKNQKTENQLNSSQMQHSSQRDQDYQQQNGIRSYSPEYNYVLQKKNQSQESNYMHSSFTAQQNTNYSNKSTNDKQDLSQAQSSIQRVQQQTQNDHLQRYQLLKQQISQRSQQENQQNIDRQSRNNLYNIDQQNQQKNVAGKSQVLTHSLTPHFPQSPELEEDANDQVKMHDSKDQSSFNYSESQQENQSKRSISLQKIQNEEQNGSQAQDQNNEQLYNQEKRQQQTVEDQINEKLEQNSVKKQLINKSCNTSQENLLNQNTRPQTSKDQKCFRCDQYRTLLAQISQVKNDTNFQLSQTKKQLEEKQQLEMQLRSHIQDLYKQLYDLKSQKQK